MKERGEGKRGQERKSRRRKHKKFFSYENLVFMISICNECQAQTIFSQFIHIGQIPMLPLKQGISVDLELVAVNFALLDDIV